MLSFLSPLFLIGAAAAAIPIVLHLLKREPEVRLKFSAVKLLRRAPVEHSRRRHLNELLLLALRVAALLLLALAFARPFFASSEALQSSGVTVVALDTSMSLSAPGQFARAKQLAKDAIARAARGERVGVVTFSDTAQVAATLTGDRGLAVSAVEAAAAGFGATRYRAALNAAADMLAGAPGTIVVVTDLQESGWDEGDRVSVPESTRIEVADVGSPPANLAVTAVRSAADRVTAVVRNTGPAARDARVRLTVDDRLAGEAAASIGPNQSAEVTLPAARGAAGAVTVDDGEGAPADNVRYAIFENAVRPAVLILSAAGDLGRDAFYVQHALTAAGSDGASYQVEGVSGSQLSSWDLTRLRRYAAVAMLSTRGLERRGRELLAEYARNGGGLLVAAGPTIDAEVAAGALAGAVSLVMPAPADRERTRALAPGDVRHPIFQTFGPTAASLGLVKFQRIASIRGATCQTLARFTTGEAALVDCAIRTPDQSSEGRALLIASDLDNNWNDFPLHATFVPFLHEAVRYLAGGAPRTSDYVVADVPAGVPPTPGIVSIPDAGGGLSRRVAVNVDPAESDPARLSADEFQTAVVPLKDVARAEARLEAREEEDRQHIWQYVLIGMLAILVVESVVGTRTA